MFNKYKKTYGFRKAKAVTTIGGTEVGNKVIKGAIATAVAVVPLAVGGVASADEVTATTETNPNPATNLVDVQPQATAENTAQTSNANTPAGDFVGTVDSGELNTAVSNAQNAGVQVTTETTAKTYENILEAQSDISNQVTQVKEATEKQEANTTAIKEATEENAKIDAENKAEAERVAKENEEGQKKIDEANAKAQAEADAKNAKAQADADARNAELKSDYEKALANYQEKTKQTQQNLEAFEKAKSSTSDSLPISSTGYTASGSTTHLTSVTMGGMEFVSSGDLKNPTVYIKGENIDTSKIVTSIEWGNVAPEGEELTQGTYGAPGFYWTGAYNYNVNGTTTQIWTGKIKTWYKIPNAISTMDGKKHDAYIMADVDPAGLYRESAETKTDGQHFVFWNQDGAINSLDGFRSPASINPESDGIRMIIKMDSPDNNDNIIWTSTLYDFDMGQYLEVDSQSSALLAVGGGMKADKGNVNSVASDENLGVTYGINMDGNALNGRASSPDGTILLLQFGNSYNTIIRNTPGGYGSAVARADFGAESKVDLKVIETTPEPKTPDYVTPEQVTPTKLTFTPATPTVKPHVTVPEKEEYKVSVHPVQVKQNPTISKTVSNDSGQDVDGKLVPKGAEAPYTLKTAPLKAGRPAVKEKGGIVITDNLPSGYILSDEQLAKTISEAEKQGFVAQYDAGTHSFTFTLNEEETKAVNSSRLTTDYDVPDPIIYGTPSNDNATYINAYTLDIYPENPSESGDGEGGKITTTSNKVVIYTAGTDDPNDPEHGGSTIQPTKQVFDEDGNDIDGKPVKNGQKIVYVGKWDLDQYKGIVAGAVAISKGFGFIDNYDETAVTMDIDGTTIKSASGKDVKGLTPHVIKNLAEAPQEIKDLVKNSGIEIADNDEFVIWVADDPQAFYDEFVVTGDSVFFTMPAQVKEDYNGDKIDNIVYQIDFGNGYAGNIVTNTVGHPEDPQKPVSPEPTATTPIAKGSVLPQTGEKSNSFLVSIGATLLAIATGFTLGKSKKNED